MKISESWLREWVDPKVDTQTLADQLTMAGLEVDGIEPAAPPFSGVVVAEIISAERHPDADKLQACTVNTGGEEPLQIICGAKNARAGLRVACAQVGAVLPDLKIKRAKLRGVESFGMLCSVTELGLGEAADGIMELPADAPVGTDLRDWLQLDDQVIEVDLTPNRGDCLGMAGIAREVSTLNRTELKQPNINPVESTIPDEWPVDITATDDCRQYVGRVIRGLDRSATTPMWMVERLRRAGVRSLGPLVDVTNYVMLELGQPMHAFDLGKLEQGITVRRARTDEPLELIGGTEVKLDDDCLVIADGDSETGRAIALAGVMGGAATAVDDDTIDILLESAFFEPTSIAGRARRFGLHTDSSHRFERGVDPALQTTACERATGLLLDICGGQAGPVFGAGAANVASARPAIALRRQRIVSLLGLSIPDADVTAILGGLGMRVELNADGWTVIPPSFRFDIAIEADLLEELARIHGYDNLPTATARSPQRPAVVTEARGSLVKLRQSLIANGFREVITYSFIDPALDARFNNGEPIRLLNPISSEMAVMRSSLWPGLIQTAQRNLNRQQTRMQLFETGLRFTRDGDTLLQQPRLAGLALGDRHPPQPDDEQRKVDFFDVKADVERLLAAAGRSGTWLQGENPVLHPGQSAEIHVDGQSLGWIGTLHPALATAFDLGNDPVVLFDLDLDLLLSSRLPAFAEIPRYPSIRRDLALIVDDMVSVQQLLAAAKTADSERIQDAFVFDVYRGKEIESGRKSVALGLILQDKSTTLTDTDAESIMTEVIRSLAANCGADIRG